MDWGSAPFASVCPCPLCVLNKKSSFSRFWQTPEAMASLTARADDPAALDRADRREEVVEVRAVGAVRLDPLLEHVLVERVDARADARADALGCGDPRAAAPKDDEEIDAEVEFLFEPNPLLGPPTPLGFPCQDPSEITAAASLHCGTEAFCDLLSWAETDPL